MTEKTCEVCARRIEPRKKWEKNWDQIKYCSDVCRGMKKSENFEGKILDLLKKRGAGKTICPSEVLESELRQNKEMMESVRRSARKLVLQGKIVITQKGQVVDPSTAKGAIRLKMVKP